jgi:hypothetical protein
MPSRRKSQGSTALSNQAAVSLLQDLSNGGQLGIADIRAMRAKRDYKISEGEWIDSIALLCGGGFARKQDGHYEITNKGIDAIRGLVRTQYRAETH